jgi:hypothetical protein
VSGTLLELVELLSQRGRKFVYVPQPAQSEAQPVVVAVEEVSEDDGQPAVYWKSPEAWQAPAALADAPLADPMESMMRQLSGGEPALPASYVAPVAPATRAQTESPFAPARLSKPGATRGTPRDAHGSSHRGAHGGAVQVAEWRGYTMSLTVQPVRNRMFRAAVEILKDGTRLERSGLIGPPFQDREAARNFAFDWAREWVEREGPDAPAASAARSASQLASQPVAQSAAQPALAHAPRQSAGVARGDPSNAVVARALPGAVPGSVPGGVRIAPMQRYTATGTLLTGSEGRDAKTSASGTAERRPIGVRYRTLGR